MNKKGFISISVVYSFFLVFIAIVLSILAAYSSRRYMLIEIKTDIRNIVDEKTTNICLSKGITKLNECIVDTYGGKDYIESQATPDFSKVTVVDEYGLYAKEDDFGTSYYFRGDVDNNYVKFGQNVDGYDMYWRIVRINGDGSIRLVYDGTELVENGTVHTATIKSAAYNGPSSTNAKYIGYTYDVDGTQVDSTIKDAIDEWYEANLKTNYETYIEDGIFCNDRSGAIILYNVSIYYAPYWRLCERNINPLLTCANKSDRYTKNDTTKGNGLLSNSVGLLTADEVFLAGGAQKPNNTNYLYSGEAYWTSSPNHFDGSGARVLNVNSNGSITNYLNYVTNTSIGVRPVINLKADVEIKKGNGTISSPYVLEEEND